MSAEIRVWEPVDPDDYNYGYTMSDGDRPSVTMTPPGSPERAHAAATDAAKGGVGEFIEHAGEKFFVHKVETDSYKVQRVHSAERPPFGEWQEVTA